LLPYIEFQTRSNAFSLYYYQQTSLHVPCTDPILIHCTKVG